MFYKGDIADEPVFLVSEVWLDPGKIEDFKSYRIKFLDLIDKFDPVFFYYGHPFEWALNVDEGMLPTGIEIWQFQTEKTAKNALDLVIKTGLLEDGKRIFSKVRCYLARQAPQGNPVS